MKDQKINLCDRPIKSIGWLSPIEEWLEVGSRGIDQIDVQEQFCGEYSIYWFQVWKKGRIVARYNARNVDSVLYEEII